MYNSDWSKTKESSKPRAVNRESVRVLVAEDSPLNLQVALKQLEKLGYQADSASDGTEVMSALAKRRYDVILMDCQMPEMSGFDATAAIRTMERDTGRHVRIVALTAHAMAGDRARCLEAGMDDYVTKPLTLDALSQVLDRVSPALT